MDFVGGIGVVKLSLNFFMSNVKKEIKKINPK